MLSLITATGYVRILQKGSVDFRSLSLLSASRQKVLTLYRQCLKCARRIPDLDQRGTYNIYIRHGFRKKSNLPVSSRSWILAMQDAEEQLERMIYYQSIQNKTQKKLHDDKKTTIDHLLDPSIQTQTHAMQSNRSKELNSSSLDSPSPNLQGFDDEANKLSDNDNITRLKFDSVKSWLNRMLPFLHEDDLNDYTNILVQDGFDSTYMLENELLESDLDPFMKKAHRRALSRYLKETSKK